MTAEAVERVAVLEREVAELRARYAADSKNYRLGEQVGLATARLVCAKRDALIPEKTAAVEAMRAANLVYRNRPTITGRDWEAALPAHCPRCGGWVPHSQGQERPLRALGHSSRVGERGVRCGVCHHEYKVG